MLLLLYVMNVRMDNEIIVYICVHDLTFASNRNIIIMT